MASGPIPKRVTCPQCGAPQGVPCRQPDGSPARKAHPQRQEEALVWYDTRSMDGLTPRRRDQMVEALQKCMRSRGDVGRAMQRITTAPDPEAEYRRLTETAPGRT